MLSCMFSCQSMREGWHTVELRESEAVSTVARSSQREQADDSNTLGVR
jgi:hypothetical protein